MTILRACVKCGTPSEGPYCPVHRPRNFDRRKPFWGGQGRTSRQAKERKAFLLRHPICELRLEGCEIEATQVDHVTPQSRGGADDESNWQPACAHCNLKKGGGR